MNHVRLREDIIQELSQGPKPLSLLVSALAERHAISVQAVYKMFRILRKQEVVSVHNKKVSLSLVWVSQQKETFSLIEQAYKHSAYVNDLLVGKTGRLTFTFKTLNELELFWTHVFILIAEDVDVSYPSYSIQPHDWFGYSREGTTKYWNEKHQASKRISRFVVTHTLPLDKIASRERREKQGRLFQYLFNHNPLNQKDSISYNLLGDYVFKVIFDKSVSDRLNAFIAKNTKLPLSKESQNEIADILSEKGRFTLTVYKSSAKASAMEMKVRKFFE